VDGTSLCKVGGSDVPTSHCCNINWGLAMSLPIRVMVVDDHPMVRAGLSTMLRSANGIELVGEASSGQEAIALCAQLAPQVVLMDLKMPAMDGATAATAIRQANREVQIIMLTAFYDPDLVQNAMQAGAIGYLLKTSGSNEITDAIRNAVQRRRTLAPEATEALIQAVQDDGIGEDLTVREKEVLRLMTLGKSNQDIADHMNVALPTVKFHANNIFSKLGTKSRAEAIHMAYKHKLLEKM
jgi:two-component system, NarL family, response regulator LiaR